MTEILITSSALILALLVLRRLFRSTLSRRVQYALWGLVLVRLLIPSGLFHVPAADFSVLTATAPMRQVVDRRLDRVVLAPAPAGAVQAPDAGQAGPAPNLEPASDHVQPQAPLPQSIEPGQPFQPQPAPVSGGVTAGQALTWIWMAGMALTGTFFLLSNLLFYAKLRKNRRRVDPEIWDIYAQLLSGYGGPSLRRRAYLVDGDILPSPCLFGRAIYLTPAALQTEDSLCHVLAHEETHARHLDPVWSLLRCVCLTVYWFDPLVWVAARCAKTDCELACDESVLARLGEDERIGYGKTLLSLIPVRRLGNPLLSATTMTSGKKQLKDRITRIAQKPRQLAAALVAVAVLVGIVSACSFAGGKGSDSTPANDDLRPLTGEELRWFNEEFFNSSAAHRGELHARAGGDDIYYNLRNQFANPINLYERPQDIDLYELFYCEGTSPSDQEIRDILDMDPDDLPCPTYKITTNEINDILTLYTGLTLEQANKESLTYTYDETTDAYYWMHGDTNYCGDLHFTVGTREGNTVKLYHPNGFTPGGRPWYCVTLEEQADGSYWFRSNAVCDQPAIPTPLPDWEPLATISLNELKPFTLVTMDLGALDGSEVPGAGDDLLGNYIIDDHNVVLYRASDGLVYAATRQEDGSVNVFFQFSYDDVAVVFFYDLFGYNGFSLTYTPGAAARLYPTDTDYYYFDPSGVPVLFARCHGDSRIIDLDGDGHSELVAPRQIFFQRDNAVYEALLTELLTACPELSYWYGETWDMYGKYLSVRGYTEDNKECVRHLYFDGENILVYRDEKPYTDHMVDGADKGVPQAVVAAARDYAKGNLAPLPGGLWHPSYEGDDAQELYDDWRIERFDGPYRYPYGGAVVEGWWFNYEFHTTTPQQVVLAGGKYLTEDDWVSPGYPGCDALFFEVKADGSYRLLYGGMVQEGHNSVFVNRMVLRMMEEYGVELAPGFTYDNLFVADDLDQLLDHSGGGVLLALDPGDGTGGESYTVDPEEGSGPYVRKYFADPEAYRWTRLDTVRDAPTGASLTLARSDWSLMFRFWEGSDLVMRKGDNEEPVWYRVENQSADAGVFAMMRHWLMQTWSGEAQGAQP